MQIRLHSFLLLGLCLFGLFACTTPKQPPLPVGSLKLGIAPFNQPTHIHDMLAGTLPDEHPAIAPETLHKLDAMFAESLARQSQNMFVSSRVAELCLQKTAKDSSFNRQTALKRAAALGRCMGVDILVVPHIVEWRERDGGDLGVQVPAKVILDVYVVDVANEALLSRSHYDETQSALTSNLLDAKKFFQRGGKWVKAEVLAQEGIDKAIQELGL